MVDYQVDVAALDAAIDQVAAEHQQILAGVNWLKNGFTEAEGYWKSPAGNSFAALGDEFIAAANQVVTLLDEAIGRMRTASQNYKLAEEDGTTNYANVSQALSEGPPGGNGPSGDSGGDGTGGPQSQLVTQRELGSDPGGQGGPSGGGTANESPTHRSLLRA